MFHRHGRRGGFGPGPFGPDDFHGGHFGRRGRGMRGGGRGRGEMKYEILAVLTEGARHGYDIMLEIESKTGMRPSAGSIYPALQMLEDGDFIKGEERDGKRVFTITDKGRELLAQREPEDAGFDGENFYAIIAEAMRQVHGIKDAVKQIARSGNIETYKQALAVLDKARRELFAIIADTI
jgi:DNA-binding PadR family transcriptional regulator